MKFGYYVMYGKAKEGLETLEDYVKGFDKFAEAVKKVELKMMFWGSPRALTI